MTSPIQKMILWRKDPVQFVKDVFGAIPDAWQVEALMAFAKHQRLAMVASKGVGKTTLLAWCVWNFLLTRPQSKVACTSISFDNLSDGLRSELAFWHSKTKLLQRYFNITKTRISCHEDSESWFCSFRAWSKSADANQQALTLAGLHADYMLFVCDEVGSYPEAILATAEAALASGIETKLVVVGNPTDVNGPLYRITTKAKSNWHIQHINSDPENPNRSPRVSVQWAKEQIEMYGYDSDYVRVNVRGLFPKAGSNNLFSLEDLEKSFLANPEKDSYQNFQKRLGVDVARMGEDSTIIFPRQGKLAFNPIQMREAKTNEIVTRITLSIDKWGAESMFIDGTGGFGAGVVDGLQGLGFSPYEVHFSSKADDDRFNNKRTEMYWRLNEWIKQGGSIPEIPELKEELLAHTFNFNSRGQFCLEPKDMIKSRIGRSPDYSDALALTFHVPDVISNQLYDKTNRSNLKHDYDPFK